MSRVYRPANFKRNFKFCYVKLLCVSVYCSNLLITMHILKYLINSSLKKNSLRFSVCSFSNFSKASETQNGNRYKIHILPALTDNYMYVLTDNLHKTAIAVDPVEPDKILSVTESEKVDLKAVFTTHHHFDHAGGNELIRQKVKDLPIYGGDTRIESLTHELSHNQVFSVGELKIKCLHTPCHTKGHVCYFIESCPNLGPVCFTGDTLFVAGCGKFFEGTAKDMLHSLSLLATLPPNTKVYCGHEYTLNNLKFAMHVEPSNTKLADKFRLCQEKLKSFEPTVPTTLEEELSYNPFLRVKEMTVQRHTNKNDPVAVMAALRKEKDNF